VLALRTGIWMVPLPAEEATGPGRAPKDATRSEGGGEVRWEVVYDEYGVALADRALAAIRAPQTRPGVAKFARILALLHRHLQAAEYRLPPVPTARPAAPPPPVAAARVGLGQPDDLGRKRERRAHEGPQAW